MTNTADHDHCSVVEAARLLGVSRTTVWRWIKNDKLPAYRIGPRNFRIRKEDLSAAVQPAPGWGKPGQDEHHKMFEPPSRVELARRRALIPEILALREQCDIKPLTTTDLLRLARAEDCWNGKDC